MQMGCSASKVDNEEVVLMCRERKRFIKQAVDQRYVLAAAHVEYIQALGGIGIALRAFAEGEMLLLSSLPASESPAANSHEKKSPEHVVIPGKSSTSSSLHLHSDSHTHSHHSHSHSHSHSESPPAESPSSSPLHFHEHSESPPSYGSPIRFDYMRSVNTPSRTHEEKPLSPERVTWNSYTRDSQYEMNSFFDIPMGLPPNAAPPPGPSYSPNHPPPPPSPPKNSAWDIFNPFVSFLSYDAESVYPYYGRGRLSPASEGSSHDSKHVREEEGIPDLEEEDQGEDGKKKVQGEKKAAEKGKASDIGSPGSVVENSTRSVAQPNPDESIEEKVPSKGTEGEDGEKAEGKTGDMAVDKAVLENRDVNEDDSLALSVTQGTRNVVEVLTDVENEFKRAQDSGKEVAKMLEANKVPYRPRFTILKALSARVLNAITWHQARPSVPSSSKRPRSSKPKKFADDSGYDFDEDCGMVSGSHSSTLDKIYVWEKKLYEEVKAGEKIRIEYERKVLQLKHQDDKGEDPHLVDATRTATKNLQTKINVAIQVVDSISKRIHTLRDEELQPQVAELIEGFVRMWRVMFDCHQKQNKIISGAKSLGRVAASGVSSETHLKATLHLENELHNWRACFSNWIGAQRAYVQALNGWLLKCLHQEPEETPDGTAPFSPRRVGAPPVFIICNDWSQAFDTFPESEVSNAIEKFAAAVKGVVEHQDEEQRQKRRTEFLKDDLNRRVQTLQRMESRLHEPQPSDKKIESDIGQASAGLAEQKISLDALRRQVEQENAKHHNVMQETLNVTLNTLQSDLKLVFEAMTEFTVSSLKTYEQLSVHSGRENLPQVNGERGRDSFSHANGETSHMKDA